MIMLKKFIVMAVTLAAIGSAASAFAAVTGREAEVIASKEVPMNAVNFGLAKEGSDYLVSFYDKETYRDFNVYVDSESGKVRMLNIKGSNTVGSTMLNKTEEDVKNAVLAKYPDARKLEVRLVQQGLNNRFYEATFSTEKFRMVEMEVSPVTCAFGKINITYK